MDENKKAQDMFAINDPLGQTHKPASSDHYAHLKLASLCEIWDNSDHYRLWLWVGRVDQFNLVISEYIYKDFCDLYVNIEEKLKV